MKTALTQMIEDLKEAGFNVEELTIMPKYLELEKEQIIKAYMCDGTFTNIFEAEQYYNETFK